MDINFMRAIDHRVGVPLCYLFSGYDKVKRLFSKSSKVRIKKVLYIELAEMGSTILAYPSMKKLKSDFPDSVIYFLCFKKNIDAIKLLRNVPDSNIFTIDTDNIFKFIISTFQTIFKLRKEKIDTILDLELFSRFSILLSYMIGAKTRVGFNNFHSEGLYRGSFQTHKVMYNTQLHMSQNIMALVESLSGNPSDVPLIKTFVSQKDFNLPRYISTVEKKEIILSRLKSINPKINSKSKIIVINPDASKLLPLRKWPLMNYAKLVKKLIKEHNDIFIVLTGMDHEKKNAWVIGGYVKSDRCIDFIGKTKDLNELLDLYNLSKVLVTQDSGPPHFAALTNIKIIVMFGPETPNLYSPLSKNMGVLYSNLYCSPCVLAFNHRKSPCNNNQCLKLISVEQVYDEVVKSI